MSPAPAPLNPPVRFTRLVLKVNAFLLVAFLLAGAFMGLVAYKQGWFIPHSTIVFLTPNALGVNVGMPVKLYGFTVGSVREMDIAYRGVEVRMSIMSDHLTRLPKGTIAKFSREAGLVGASVIDLVPPKNPTTETLSNHDRIEYEAARNIAEIVDDLRRQIAPAFNEMKNVLGDVARSREDIIATVHDIRAGVEGLPETHRALRRLLNTADRTINEVGQQMGATLKAAERASDTAERAAGSVEKAVPALVIRLSTSLDSIDAATGQIRRTGEEAQETLRRTRPIIERGETAAREAGEVVSAAKRVWPLADSFKEGDRMLPIDSFEARNNTK
jgi:phospholipid/cholesterol/gamma-HCH transport system substrate-binding protein